MAAGGPGSLDVRGFSAVLGERDPGPIGGNPAAVLRRAILANYHNAVRRRDVYKLAGRNFT